MKWLISLMVLVLSWNALAAEVLVVGDSHNVGFFGDALYQGLQDQLGLSVRSVGLAGASGTTYAADKEALRTLKAGFANRQRGQRVVTPAGTPVTVPKLSDLIAEEKPRLVVVELGDNFAGYKSKVPDSFVAKQVEMVLKEIEKKSPAPRCFWITPVWTDQEGTGLYKKTNTRLSEVNKLIKKAAGTRCTVIDSTQDLGLVKTDLPVLSDGIHFGKQSGTKWGKAAAQRISDLLRATKAAPTQSGAQ